MDPATIARVKDLARRAALRENWYHFPGTAAVPGDSPKFREIVGGYKVVFTWTKHPTEGLYRHMSISLVPRSSKLPAPHVVFTVATWLGFGGAQADEHGVVQPGSHGRDWIMDINTSDRCVVVAQRIPDEERG